jgi:hypothetical protein
MSPNSRASCAAASPRTPTILDSLSPARWAARSVTSSLSRSAEGTIGQPHRSRDERAWWKQAGIDPIKVARRLWKTTHGRGQRQSQRPVLPRPYGAAASSDPTPKGVDISATATTQEETRLPDLLG